MVLCPECENDLDLDVEDLEEGDVVMCPECATEFEVITADPLELVAVKDEDDEEDEKPPAGDEEDE